MLFRKMLRDIRLHSGQFISIFMLTFLAVFLFTGVTGEVVGVENARKKYHAETVLADGWIYVDQCTDDEAKSISKIKGIEKVQSRMFETAGDNNGNTVFLYREEENIVNCPLVLEGEDYDPTSTDSIWLAKRFAEEQSIKIGDEYTVVLADGLSAKLKVAGLIWSSEYEYYKDDVDLEPDYHDTGYAFVGRDAFKGEYQPNQIVFTGDISQEVQAQISVLTQGTAVILVRKDITNLKTLDDEISQHKMMAVLFPSFFIVVAMLTTITTMTRIVDRQRTQIGTFKAIGVKKEKIYIHYLSYGFFPSLIGCLFGTILGPLTLSPILFKMKYYLESSDEYMLPHFNVVYPLYFWFLGMGIVLLCTIAAWFTCRKVLKIRPSEALRPAQPKSGKKTIFEKLPCWKKFDFSGRYNLRDIARNKARTVFGLAGTISCMALILCGFLAKDNFQNAVTDLYVNKILNNSAMITLQSGSSLTEAERLKDMVNGELIMSTTVEIKKAGTDEKSSCHMNVYEDGQVARVLTEDLQSEVISGNTFTITEKTASQLQLNVGDIVEWRIYGSTDWVESRIDMITRAPFEQGIVTTREMIENSGYEFIPTRLITKEEVDDDFKDESDIIDSVTSKEGMYELLNNYMELVNLVMGFMLVLAVLLGVTVLYSLGLLSFEERKKEMATLKVLGFDTKSLISLMMKQNLILASIGVIIGIPLGIGMLRLLLNSLGDSIDIPGRINALYVLLSAVMTVIISIMVNYMFTRRIRYMNMVEETKSAE